MLSVIYCECRGAIIFIIGDEEKKSFMTLFVGLRSPTDARVEGPML